MDALLRDIRYALRALAKNPGFSTVAVLTLALGVGANTAIFSVVDAVLLRPLPYPDSGRLLQLSNQWREFTGAYVSYPEFVEMRKQTTAFEAITLYRPRSFNWSQDGQPERVQAAEATPEMFRTLGVAPVIGRPFTAGETGGGREKVVVVSYGMWQARLQGSRDLAGKQVRLNGESYSVIGVMPEGFFFPNKNAQAWIPVNEEQAAQREGRLAHVRQVVARLKPNVTMEQANAQLASVANYFRATFPNDFPAESGFGMAAETLQERIVGDSRRPLLVLLGAVGFVLLIACANVANLFLARAVARERELAIRTALGAGRGTLIRQLLVESGLLAMAGAAAGLLMAWWGVDLLANLRGVDVPRLDEVRVDARVLLFTLGLSLFTGLLFGLAPAWRVTRSDLNPSLQEGSRGSRGVAHRSFRNALVVAEVALSVVLLAGTALLMRSFWRIMHVNPGFETAGMLTANVSLSPSRYATDVQRADFYRKLLENLRNEPGVSGGAGTTILPMDGSSDILFRIEGRPRPAGTMLPVEQQRVVTSGYFRTMGIALLRGRDFSEQDRLDAPETVIINESLAKKYWNDGDALGARIAFGDPARGAAWVTVVGIVADVHDHGLHLPKRPMLFLPQSQYAERSLSLVVRSENATPPSEEILRRQVAALDPEVALYGVRPMQRVVEGSVASQRLNLLLISIFAVQALALAAVGLYGVMSYLVQQQTRETGIRMAFGASPAEVLRLYLGRGFAMFAAGLGLGLVAALLVARVLNTMLFGVTPNDPLSYVAISVVLAGVTALACWIPARRAARVDPMVALRHE